MINVDDNHLLRLLLDAIAKPVFATTRPPQALEGSPERRPYNAGSLRERAADELPHSECHGRWQGVGQGSTRPGRQDHRVALIIGHVIPGLGALP